MTDGTYWHRWLAVGVIALAALILLGRVFWVNPLLEALHR